MSPLDLHVLGTPPAFVLSQDQTLPFNPSIPSRVSQLFGIFAVSFLIARFFSVSFSRFASLVLTAFQRASLHRISNGKGFVNSFLEGFSEKIKANQRFRTLRFCPGRMFGFWHKAGGSFHINIRVVRMAHRAPPAQRAGPGTPRADSGIISAHNPLLSPELLLVTRDIFLYTEA